MQAAAFYSEQAAELHRLHQRSLQLQQSQQDALCPTEAAICYHQTIRVIQLLQRSEFRSSCVSFHDLEVARAESLASTFPTVIVYVVDTPRCTSPTTFMSNMLYACRFLPCSPVPLRHHHSAPTRSALTVPHCPRQHHVQDQVTDGAVLQQDRHPLP